MNDMRDVSEDTSSPLKKLVLALQQETTGGSNKRGADFKEAYPTIERYLALKIPQKVLLGQFNDVYGHKLHPPGFRKMLEAERMRRSENGDDAACACCGQRLQRAAESEDHKNDAA